jgi:hypothetical protein
MRVKLLFLVSGARSDQVAAAPDTSEFQFAFVGSHKKVEYHLVPFLIDQATCNIKKIFLSLFLGLKNLSGEIGRRLQ